MQQAPDNKGKREVTLTDNQILSADLFRSCREIAILHNNEAYKLRLTGNGKLILTK